VPHEIFKGRVLAAEHLAGIRRELKSCDAIEGIDDEMRALIVRNWPDLAAKLPPAQLTERPAALRRRGLTKKQTIPSALKIAISTRSRSGPRTAKGSSACFTPAITSIRPARCSLKRSSIVLGSG
jgi:hypothetical protein